MVRIKSDQKELKSSRDVVYKGVIPSERRISKCSLLFLNELVRNMVSLFDLRLASVTETQVADEMTIDNG